MDHHNTLEELKSIKGSLLQGLKRLENIEKTITKEMSKESKNTDKVIDLKNQDTADIEDVDKILSKIVLKEVLSQEECIFIAENLMTFTEKQLTLDYEFDIEEIQHVPAAIRDAATKGAEYCD
ncbi:MAG: Unknown protein [uncultured Sulfurovum sp.]|uniref:Uncharacterized protein n=1 Tax=uncultured Sulfurovum sp. TaxID=269237 RepID=A0A6S6SHW4_9BACT|nr:MAG: Unknown protein [uncultured Sulfurovum sp.]